MTWDVGDLFINSERVGQRTTVTDDFDSRRDQDVYRFRLERGEGVRLQTDVENNGIPDTVLALYDRQGNLIEFDNDGGAGPNESEIEFENTGATGRFFAVVTPFDRLPTDEVGEGNLNGPNYRGRGDAEDVGVNYSLHFDYFDVIA